MIVFTEIVTKLYLYYSKAWWHDLGLIEGDFEMAGDARNMLLKGKNTLELYHRLNLPAVILFSPPFNDSSILVVKVDTMMDM